jgi:hypothetical protein
MIAIGWLWVFAGHVRSPGATKTPWAVLASRILAAAGAVFLIRLTLFPHEERVPVVSIDHRVEGGNVEGVSRLLRLQSKGYEVVPLDDVVMLVRERRYVPKKCLSIVIRISSLDDIGAVVDHVGESPITLVLEESALGGKTVGRTYRVPDQVAVGVSISGRGEKGVKQTEARLTTAQRAIASILGRKIEYALLEDSVDIDLKRLCKSTGITAFLNGKGFNRHGDEAHLIRLMDVTGLVNHRTLSLANLRAHLSLFKGSYYVWPAAAMVTLLAGKPAGGT